MLIKYVPPSLHPAFNPALPFFSPKVARDFRQKIDQIKLHTIGQQ